MIKIFSCGRCKEKIGTRQMLRKHLREDHLIKRNLTNFTDSKGKPINQPWWKWEEFK